MNKDNFIKDFVFVRDYTCKALKNSGISIAKKDIIFALLDYRLLYPNGISAMRRFIEYGKNKGMKKEWILGSIVHDIYGRHDSCFSPRTSSY
jgi:hypothetical protein